MGNARDADASDVWICLPGPLEDDPAVIREEGAGMTAHGTRGDYLNSAKDKRTRSGERTHRHNRKIKGRKGIADSASARSPSSRGPA